MGGGNDFRIGKGVEGVFEEVLNARQALVVSPWIQEPYASRLLKMVMEGRAKVVTSMDRENTFYTLLGGVGAQAIITQFIGLLLTLFGAGMIIAGLVGLAMGFGPGDLIILGFLSLFLLIPGLVYLRRYLRQRRLLRERPWLSNVRLSPPLGQDGFIHIKLYIADDRAWVGSANMTVSAWKHNIEVLVPIDVGTARRIFEWAWSHASPPS